MNITYKSQKLDQQIGPPLTEFIPLPVCTVERFYFVRCETISGIFEGVKLFNNQDLIDFVFCLVLLLMPYK